MRTPVRAAIKLYLLVAVVISSSTAALGQPAPTSNYTSIDATSGKPVQLSYHASAHKNCAPAPLPTIHVTQPPKSGVLTVRRAILSTDKVAGCPHIKVPAQVVFYQAHPSYTGPDHLDYEVTNENGEVTTYDITITVKAPPATNPPVPTKSSPL